jgi:hypothetical protein
MPKKSYPIRLSAKEIIDHAIGLKPDHGINVALWDPDASESWIRIECIKFFDTVALLIGGYGYPVEVLDNIQDYYDKEERTRMALNAFNEYSKNMSGSENEFYIVELK